MFFTRLVRHSTSITPINRHPLDRYATIVLAVQRAGQQLPIVGLIRCDLHIGQQLHGILRLTGFAQVDHIATPMGGAPFYTVGGVRIMGRLQTVGAHGVCRSNGNRAVGLYVVLLLQNPLHQGSGLTLRHLGAQLCGQLSESLTQRFQVGFNGIDFDAVADLLWASLQVGGQPFLPPRLVCLIQLAIERLHH